MRNNSIFDALSYVDDIYLSTVETLENETLKNKNETQHRLHRKSFSILVAAVICVSILATTVLAAGFIPGIFNAMKNEVPEDEALFSAAAEANTDAAPEIREIPQLDLTKFTLFEKYYDGETILLGYDLSAILPEPMVGYVPENEDWTTIKSGNSIGELSAEAISEWQDRPLSESTLYENMSDSCKSMDLNFRGMLTSEEYENAMRILQAEGRVCVMTHDIWIGDHIYVNGADIGEVISKEVATMRYDYEIEEGTCIKLNPLPKAGFDQDTVTVTLNIRSCEEYWYMDLDGTATYTTGNHKSAEIDFIIENLKK